MHITAFDSFPGAKGEGNEPADWFALTVTPQREKQAADTLCQKGLEVVLPSFRERRRWSDRIKELERPLFPGYVFCRFVCARKVHILRVPWVRSIVGFGGGPEPIPEAEIGALLAMTRSGQPLEPWPYLAAGSEVRVTAGPFRGCRGTVVKCPASSWRLVVSIHLLQRSVAVEIDRAMLVP